MKKKIAPPDNEANLKNKNKGTIWTNLQYDKAQGNRGKLLAEKEPVVVKDSLTTDRKFTLPRKQQPIKAMLSKTTKVGKSQSFH